MSVEMLSIGCFSLVSFSKILSVINKKICLYCDRFWAPMSQMRSPLRLNRCVDSLLLLSLLHFYGCVYRQCFFLGKEVQECIWGSATRWGINEVYNGFSCLKFRCIQFHFSVWATLFVQIYDLMEGSQQKQINCWGQAAVVWYLHFL